jgi:hypothetical protein
MRTLKLDMAGDDVLAWELFLRGQGYYWVEADGKFDEETAQATRNWQKSQELDNSGNVDIRTYGKAQLLGFNPGFEDDSVDESGPNWPPKPDFPSLNFQVRASLFGQFAFKPAGVPDNPEAIIITDGWEKKNISRIDIPVLDALDKHLGDDRFQFNIKCADQIQNFFKAVGDAGLANRILTWGGSWVPRYVRGSRVNLSNHSWGTAFDINVAWNGLNVVPPLKGQKGSVRELVPIAHQFGLYWGGFFEKRVDAMHFEIAKLL